MLTAVIIQLPVLIAEVIMWSEVQGASLSKWALHIDTFTYTYV